MSDKRATDLLRDEHRSIEKVVAAMVVTSDRLQAGREVKAETLSEAVDFMHLVWQTHERKEELHLFPALQRKGIAIQSVPTRALMDDHKKGQAMVAHLEKAAAEFEGAPMAVRESLVAALRVLAGLYPLHIWQEDLLLFHQADTALTPEDDAELRGAFAAVDETAGGEVGPRLRDLAAKLEKAAW